EADAGVPADYAACALAALVVAVTHSTLGLATGKASTSHWATEPGRSALLHITVFSVAFALISIIRGAARIAPRRSAAQAWLTRIAIAFVIGVFMDRVVLSALSMTGRQAFAAATAFGAAIALALAPRGTQRSGGVECAFNGLVPGW